MLNVDQVYMPNGTDSPPGCPDLQNAGQYPGCLGQGTAPYLTSVSDPLNYGAEVHFDHAKQLHYFYAIIVEWFDRYGWALADCAIESLCQRESISVIKLPRRNQTTNDYALSYPSQYNSSAVEKFGTWPIIYEVALSVTLSAEHCKSHLPGGPSTHLLSRAHAIHHLMGHAELPA